MTDHTLTTIITAGRNALARSGADSRLRAVAATYAQQAVRLAPGHGGAEALLCDVEREVARSIEFNEWLDRNVQRHGRADVVAQ